MWKIYIFAMENNDYLKIRLPEDLKLKAMDDAKAKGTTVSSEIRKLLKMNLLTTAD